ncbi:MAG: hypothetical protein ACF8AM_16845 [Rhodopirellula sp. JB055]|uniref:hypothetical protein n=1 Tax=Rhodopirellula sp. JB055 TaxID=3342846 RepID=UPI00370B0C82
MLLAVASLAFTIRAQGAATITIGDGSVPVYNQGDLGVSIPVFISSNETGNRLLGGYNLAFDFEGVNNFGMSSSFTNFRVVFPAGYATTSSVSGDPFPFDNFADNYDFQVGGNYSTEPAINAEAGQTKLFDLQFDVTGAAVVGTYNFNFVPDGTQFGFGVNSLNDGLGVSTLTLEASGGQFEIGNAAAVPEPTSMLALAGVFAAGGIQQFRRKKRA